MKTLVIHPADKSTDFLSTIYADTDWTIIRAIQTTKSHLRKSIKEHDRIICMGHGDPTGLVREYKIQLSYMIDSTYVQMLREKDCIFIWCYANDFAKKYAIKGFSTGMIISESYEAHYHRVIHSPESVKKSNEKFALAIKKCVSLPTIDMKSEFHKLYIPESNVEQYNNERIFYES